MKWIDTHSHLYLEDFDADRREMMERCCEAGVIKVLLPNIDTGSIDLMLRMKAEFSGQVDVMMGLHPCSVGEDYRRHLSEMEQHLENGPYHGIGEIGLDFYWDKSHTKEQEDAFMIQLQWSVERGLPVSIHSREATEECIRGVERFGGTVRGVFHCFSGDSEQASRVIGLGMFLGIGGVLTYKKSELPSMLEKTGADSVVLETDSPFLSPVPHRGKRNESSFLPLTGIRLAEILGESPERIAAITTANALRVFYPETANLV
jgi:TatD DNase family protein